MSSDLKIGLIGLDTSHATAFARLLNDPNDEHHVSGGRVVAGFPGGSPDLDVSINRVEGFTKELREQRGVTIYDSPEAVAEASDLVIITAVDGRVHLDLFRKVVGYKKPVFIDKPMTTTTEEAKEIFRLAEEHGVPVMSCSSLRYADKLVDVLAETSEDNPIVGCDVVGPMAEQPPLPGLFWYGIHTVEIIETIMGPGCKRVDAVKNDDFDMLTFTWEDGRIATLRGHRKGHSRFGATIHRANDFVCRDLSAFDKPWYTGMLAAIMGSLPKGHSPIPSEQTVEIIRMIEAANEARATGRGVELDSPVTAS